MPIWRYQERLHVAPRAAHEVEFDAEATAPARRSEMARREVASHRVTLGGHVPGGCVVLNSSSAASAAIIAVLRRPYATM